MTRRLAVRAVPFAAIHGALVATFSSAPALAVAPAATATTTPAASAHAQPAGPTHAAPSHGTTHASPHGPGHTPPLPQLPPPPVPPAKPALPLPFLPRVTDVRIDVAEDYVVLVQQVRLPRGDYKSGDVRFYVSFGPVAPLALDARVDAERDTTEENPGVEGGAATIDFAARAPASARLLLGRPQMAGAIVQIKEGVFRRAVDRGAAILTLRAVLPTPPADKDRRHEVVARLGAPEGLPITLSRIELRALAGAHVTAASANLCGPSAERLPLKVTLTGDEAQGPHGPEILPTNALRNAGDDLCIFYQTAP